MNILLSPRNDLINTIPFLFMRCSYPYAHVLKVTNELTLEMIKVQHWKLYATHYNDDDDTLGIGLELKKLQFQYSNYGGMGVPISTEILTRCRRPFSDGLFPYFYDGIRKDDYQSALALEKNGLLCDKYGTCKLDWYWNKYCKFLDPIHSMNSFITCFCLLNVFV
jgi:hypothetical protein